MKTHIPKIVRRKGSGLINTLLLITLLVATKGLQAQQKDAKSILVSYASDYETDVTFTKDVLFGVKVGEDFYTIAARAKTDELTAAVTVTPGQPPTPTFYFHTDLETLNKIDTGQLNALTGAAKAFSTDFAPFDADVMEGFVPEADFEATLFELFFHFWTRGLPERIPYGLGYTRFTHGAQATIFYYQKGFRSGYFALKKGQHANEDPRSQTNPFPTLLIAIKGEGTMIIDGQPSKLAAGEAIIIPAGIRHEFLNANEEPLEGILLMFGEGA